MRSYVILKYKQKKPGYSYSCISIKSIISFTKILSTKLCRCTQIFTVLQQNSLLSDQGKGRKVWKKYARRNTKLHLQEISEEVLNLW